MVTHDSVLHFGGRYHNLQDIDSGRAYATINCGHCGANVGAAVVSVDGVNRWLRCNACGKGSVLVTSYHHGRHGGFNREDLFPGPLPGERISHLPEPVDLAYEEARRCYSVNAFAAVEVTCRKILSHVAVDTGAEAGLTFAGYVDHLRGVGYITPPMADWAGLIRTHGNAAVHDLEPVEGERAKATLSFTAQLLKIAYEMPGVAKQFLPEAPPPESL